MVAKDVAEVIGEAEVTVEVIAEDVAEAIGDMIARDSQVKAIGDGEAEAVIVDKRVEVEAIGNVEAEMGAFVDEDVTVEVIGDGGV